MRQKLLFEKSVPCYVRLLLPLLHAANTDPPGKCVFYPIKDRILKRWGTFAGHHIQEITKPCWSCEGTGGLCEPHGCRKCGGTGIYDRYWVRLERWQIGGREFHIPSGSESIKPKRVDIKGYVRHDRHPYAVEAYLWLILVFRPAKLFRLHPSYLSAGCRRPLSTLVLLWHRIKDFPPLWLWKLAGRCQDCGRWRIGDRWVYLDRCDKCDEVPF